jgi:uncharacterized delta-60 repeat protein
LTGFLLVASSVPLAVVAVLPDSAAAQSQPGSFDPAFGSASTPGMVSSATGDGATGVAYIPAGPHAGELAVSGASNTSPQMFQIGLFTSSGAPDNSFGTSGFLSAFAGDALAVTSEPIGAPNGTAGNVVAAGYIKPSAQTCGGTAPVPAIAIAAFSPTFQVIRTDLRAVTSRTVTLSLHAGSANVTLSGPTGAALSATDAGATICFSDPTLQTLTLSQVISATSAMLSAPATSTTTVTATISGVDIGQLNAVTVDSNGNIVAAGQTTTSSGATEGLVVRLTPTGALDTSFNGTGYLQTFAVAGGQAAAFASVAVVPPVPAGYVPPTGIAPPTDVGDIVVGGSSTTASTPPQGELTVAAFTAAGTPDPNFGTSGATQFAGVAAATTANGLAVISAITLSTPQPPLGDIVAVGTTSSGGDLVQFEANGTVDTAFASNPATPGEVPVSSGSSVIQLNAVAYQPAGGFLMVAGMSTTTNSQSTPPQLQSVLVGQYNALNGSTNFGTAPSGLTTGFTNGLLAVNGVNNEPAAAAAVAVQPDGKTVIAGEMPTVNGVEGIGVMRLIGPTVSVSNAPTLTVVEPTPATVTLNFPVGVNETLATSVCPVFGVTGSGGVVATAPCAVGAPVPAGVLAATIQVQVPVTAAVGAFQVTTLTVGSGSGYLPSPTSPSGTGTIENLAAPQASAQPNSFGATSTNLEVRGSHTPANGLNLYWQTATGAWAGRVVTGAGNAFSAPALAFTKQNLQLMAVEGPSHSLRLYYELPTGAWAGRVIAGANTTFSAPSLVVSSQNLEVISVQGGNHSLSLYYELPTGAWAGRVIAGASTTFSAPSLALTRQNLGVIAAQGPSNSLRLYYQLTNGAWGGRVIAGAGSTASTPSLVVNHQGLQVIAVQSAANGLLLYYELPTGAWAGRAITGANTIASVPALVINDPGLEVIAVEAPHNGLNLYYELPTGAWVGRAITGANTTFSQPGMIINNQNLEVISAQAPSNSIRLYYEGVNGAWNGPVQIAPAGSSG